MGKRDSILGIKRYECNRHAFPSIAIAPSLLWTDNDLVMDRAFSLLSGVLNRRGLKDHAISALVVHKARFWLRERLPSSDGFVHISKIADGVLFIQCNHSIMLQECTGVIPEMKEFLARECPFLVVSDIRVVRE